MFSLLMRALRLKMWLLVVASSATMISEAQVIPICGDGDFDLSSYLSAEILACGDSSELFIVSTDISGLPTGELTNPGINISEDGQIEINVVDTTGVICNTENLVFDVITADFSATAIQGSCNIVDIVGPVNTAACTYTYTIEGNNYTGPDLPGFQFENAGLNDIFLSVQCGSCTVNELQTIDVDGPIAGLDITASGLFFDPEFDSFVLCTGELDTEVTLTDNSQQSTGANTSFVVTVIKPDGSSSTGSTDPDPYSFIADQEGEYEILYEIDIDGCISTANYDLFITDPNVNTDLNVSITITPFECEDELFEFEICPNGCVNNPPGTIYEVTLSCNDFFFQTTNVPATVQVPLNIASCASSCNNESCACDLEVRARRPCSNEPTATYCPFKVMPQPSADFDVFPLTVDNTYCEGDIVTFEPSWSSVDCNGPNPAPSICEIQNALWQITPDTGYNIVFGSLTSDSLEIQFTEPGTYDVEFFWENDCASDVHQETICILPSDLPTVDWDPPSTTYCVGQTITPFVDILPSCRTPEILWSGDDLSIVNEDQATPQVTFEAAGIVELNLDIAGLCEDFQDSFFYTVCDTPVVSLSNDAIDLCVGQEFCFNSLLDVEWNNCIGDVIWTFDSLPGQPLVNPLPDQLCFTWDESTNFEMIIFVENDCGDQSDTISVVVTDAPSCPIIPPGDFCQGGEIDIAPPLGADPSTVQWFSSLDGLTFSPTTMPDQPNASTFYYVSSQVNGCTCVSDTVLASLNDEPIFNLTVNAVNPCPGDTVAVTPDLTLGNVQWLDEAGDLIENSDTLYIIPEEADILIEGVFFYGSPSVQCSVSDLISIDPVENPIQLDCNFPNLICEGDLPVSLPGISPSGGLTSIIDDLGNTVQSGISDIDPQLLMPGSYHFLYEINDIGASLCTFRDSCPFEITSPQVPDLVSVDSLCYGDDFQFLDGNNLGGTWSSSCPGAIDLTGFFDPVSAGCPAGTDLEVYYTGECILNDTLEVFLIDIPSVSIIADLLFPCPGDAVTFSTIPPQNDITWILEGGPELGTGSEILLTVDSAFSLVVEAEAGVSTVSCSIYDTLQVVPEINPISIDCGAFPGIWCVGDESIPVPGVSPAGGVLQIFDEQGGLLLTDPDELTSEELGVGTFFLVYEIANWGNGSCSFTDTCGFEITEPQLPVFPVLPDSLCFNSTFDFDEVSGLSGNWSSSCLGSIDGATGVFDPSAAGCLPGTTVEIFYTGDCLENDTIEVFLIPIPEPEIILSDPSLCANECLPIEKDIEGDFGSFTWTLEWGSQSLSFTDNDPLFCPDELGLNTSLDVQVTLEVFTSTNPQCSAEVGLALPVIAIPDEEFTITDPQCLEEAVALPECEFCDSFEVIFANGTGDSFNCTLPGDACTLPDTGNYAYQVIYDFGSCSSDTLNGEIIIADVPYLSILESNYDPCTPVVDYLVEYGGFDVSVFWQTQGEIISSQPVENDLYSVLIDHSDEVEIDTIFTDVINVSNFCGFAEEEFTLFHLADPNFTLDPDSSVYCQGETVFVDFGIAQPIGVDSILVSFQANGEPGSTTLYEIPQSPLSFNFDIDADTVVVQFEVTAFNSCTTVTNPLTAFILPIDVSADFDIPFAPPVCPGDSIPLVFNSTGNINTELRSIITDDPDLFAVEVLGNWYLLPQEGISDGIYEIQLFEYGFCGLDIDEEELVVGPSLNPSIISSDVCLGDYVTLIPSLAQDAQLIWQITPDSSVITDFPAPVLYTQSGQYFPSVQAIAEGYCDGFYVDTVEVFQPADPLLVCSAGCNGDRGCNVNFGDGNICFEIAGSDPYYAIEWYVRNRFYPEPGPVLEITIDDLEPCEDNFITFIARDERNCEVKVTENVDFSDVLIYAPNAFSPNADGINDVFKPVVTGEPVEYSIVIYDRWGREVFSSNDPEEPWLGDVNGGEYYSNPEVFSYLIEYIPCNPEDDEDEIIISGFVTVIR